MEKREVDTEEIMKSWVAAAAAEYQRRRRQSARLGNLCGFLGAALVLGYLAPDWQSAGVLVLATGLFCGWMDSRIS